MFTTPIVFITDENYVYPTIVAIKSIEQSNPDLMLDIYVITDHVSEKKETEILKCATKTLKVSTIRAANVELSALKIKNLHVSTSAIFKFELANIFKKFDRVLYLDSDILVKKSLNDLLAIDLGESYAAVVKDFKPMSYKPPQTVKLKISHEAYFNSGVMLLNLKKIREDDISQKLYDYRKNGINYFMDQDALNVVFRENVIYLSLYFNVVSSTVGAFKAQELIDYYQLENCKTKNDIYDNAVIIHLTTKYKPWAFGNVPYSTEWMSIYKRCKLKEIKNRRILSIPLRKKIFSGIRVRIRPQELGITTPVHVNLTSYPGRIGSIFDVIRSLQKQTVRVDKIILWLAADQFPNRLNDLPKNLVSLIGNDFDIKWCEDDLKPHKKYYYAFKYYSSHINITVDDDIYYQNDVIESLLISYVRFPYAVSANRAHKIIINEKGVIEPYKNWKRDCKEYIYPSMLLLPTGVGGVLYPPNIFDEKIFDINKILSHCLFADDLWLKIHEVLNRIPVAVTAENFKLDFIADSQNEALWKINDAENQNDEQLRSIINAYQVEGLDIVKMLREFSYSEIIYDSDKQPLNFQELTNQLKKAERKISILQSSVSYRIGRLITFIPRLIIKKWKSIQK